MVWPPVDGALKTTSDYEALPEASPYKDGPWISEIDEASGDALASVTPERIEFLAAAWGRTEEMRDFDGAPNRDLAPVVRDLVELAQRAQAAGDRLYCWTCL